jgi:hypothetical protein
MNGKPCILLVSLFFYFISSWSTAICQKPPIIEWQKFIPSKGGVVSVIATTDGGFVIVANTESNRPLDSNQYMDYDIEIIKLGANGELEWQTYFGSEADEFASSIIQTNDGGFAVVGTVAYPSNEINTMGENFDACIYKLNAIGDVEWQKHFGGSKRDGAESIIQFQDNSYIVAANTSSDDGDVSHYRGGSADGWLIKLNRLGNKEWEKCFGGSDMDQFNCIRKTRDGGFVVAGSCSSKDGGVITKYKGLNTWVIKFSNNDEMEWQKSYGGSYFQFVFDIRQTLDEGYIIASSSGVYDSDVPVERDGDVTKLYGDQHDIWMIGLNSNGKLIWEKCLGGSKFDQIQSIVPSTNERYILVGYTESSDGDIKDFNGGKSDALLFQLDKSGRIAWEKCIGGSGSDAFYSAALCDDGGYLAVGSATSRDGDVIPTSDSGIWVVKFRDASTTGLKLTDKSTFNIYAYPNPATNKLAIDYTNNSDASDINIRVHDANGNQIQENISELPKGTHAETIFNVSNLSGGIYYVTVSSHSESERIKVVVVK